RMNRGSAGKESSSAMSTAVGNGVRWLSSIPPPSKAWLSILRSRTGLRRIWTVFSRAESFTAGRGVRGRGVIFSTALLAR
ncbi:hypothetical protein KI387_015910, partial [Taxus chinensis]